MTPDTSVAPSERKEKPTAAALWDSRRPLPSPAAVKSPTGAFAARISLLITHPCADEVLVLESTYGIQATGPTREEALANFWTAFNERGEALQSALNRFVEGSLHEDRPGSSQRDETPDVLKARRELAYIHAVQEWERRLQEAKAKREEECRKRREGVDTPLDEL